jgi:hypothetical protein
MQMFDITLRAGPRPNLTLLKWSGFFPILEQQPAATLTRL